MNPEINVIDSFFQPRYPNKKILFTHNATSGIYLSLKALGLENRSVVMPANICFVVCNAVINSGNIPYFLDIDDRFSIDLGELQKLKPDNLGAVILPHMYGEIANIEGVKSWCQKNRVPLIEDVAQAQGVSWKDKYLGSYGDFGVLSFGQGKVLDQSRGGLLIYPEKYHSLILKFESELSVGEKSSSLLYDQFNEKYWDLLEKKGGGEKLCQEFFEGNLHRPSHQTIKQVTEAIPQENLQLQIRKQNFLFFKEYISHPNLFLLEHSEGATYWRINYLVQSLRDELVDYLRSNDIKVSTYYPDISKMFEGEFLTPKAEQMADQLINFWPGHHTSEDEIKKIGRLIAQFYSFHQHKQDETLNE